MGLKRPIVESLIASPYHRLTLIVSKDSSLLRSLRDIWASRGVEQIADTRYVLQIVVASLGPPFGRSVFIILILAFWMFLLQVSDETPDPLKRTPRRHYSHLVVFVSI